MASPDIAHAQRALVAYNLRDTTLEALSVGHINATYLVKRDGKPFCVLQRLNPIFGANVHDDIAAVTEHLAKKGLQTPRLVPTSEGKLYSQYNDEIWRVLSFVPGHTYTQVTRDSLAQGAGQLVGRFHAAVRDLSWQFHHIRIGLHDTPRHLQHLRDALTQHPNHRGFAATLPVAQEILKAAENLASLSTLPKRVTHNDLKISNILFDDHDQGVALVDLDTFARLPIALELGDAFRSWCNTQAEDAGHAEFNAKLYEAGLHAYAQETRAFLGAEEWQAIPTGVATICFELAARFCADALEESYFGWDRARFDSSHAHNLQRAKTQLALGQSVVKQLPELGRIATSAFKG